MLTVQIAKDITKKIICYKDTFFNKSKYLNKMYFCRMLEDKENKSEKYDLIIVGSGPSGLIATGVAANKGAKVLVLEKMRSHGRKMLISGKGRCNITNDSYASNHMKNIHPNGKLLKNAYQKFFKDDILEILTTQNLEYKTERGNRVFPVSDSSKDVVNSLINWAFTKNVTVITNAWVKDILITDGEAKGVEYLINNELVKVFSNSVIIATGGMSYPATGSTGDGYSIAKKLGHKIQKPLPALVPLETKGPLAEELMGLSLKNVTASLWINDKKYSEEFGEMLFTHFGLSGPIILTLSRAAVLALESKYKVEISIDLKPALDEQKLDIRLLRDLNEFGKKQIDNIFKLWAPSKLIYPMLKLANINAECLGNQVKADQRKSLLKLFKDFRFEVISHRNFKEAIITQGGVMLENIDTKTMESNKIKRLFFAGEVLDFDANTGGYNFQIAYSTGFLASSMALENYKL